MSIDSLEETKRNPNVDRKNVQVTSIPAVQDGSSNGTSTKNEDFGRVGIFSSKTERCRILVMNLVNMLVQCAGVKCLVGYDDIISKESRDVSGFTHQSSGTYLQRQRK